MKTFDHLSLDARSLQTFLMVIEEMSVSKAADRLGVTQSTVSHTLDKLRQTFGDRLFVRSGRGIAATERAIALKGPIQELLGNMRGLMDDRPFDPARETMTYTIAANDFQRDLLNPPVLKNEYA